jgi:sugar transferase (PEP-CTERM system associated)
MLRIFGHFFPIPTLVLVLTELGSATLVLYLITHPLGQLEPGEAPLLLRFSLGLAALTVVVMMAVGLYNSDSLLDYRLGFARGVVAFLVIAPLAVAGVSILHAMSDLPRQARWLWEVEAAITWLGCLAVSRTIFVHASDLEVLKRRVVILGTGARARRLEALAQIPRLSRFTPVAFIGACGDQVLVMATGVVRLQRTDRVALAQKARELGASEVVLATDDRRGLPVDQLLECKLVGIRVIDYTDFCERETGAVDLDALQPSWFILGAGFHMGPVTEFVKRSFDVAVSLMFLLVVLPVMLFTILAIKLESLGPVLYRQARIGYRGREFTMLKFRSMHVDAERDGAPQWARQNDDRVTQVGALIRKVRIDELPQLINVLRGEMSFVGPRPERPYFVERLAKALPFYNARHAVRPGITGWAQVNYPYGASVEDARQKLSHDLYYVKNRGVFLDLVILVQTVRVILWPVGAR